MDADLVTVQATPTGAEALRFMQLRADLFSRIAAKLKRDGHCKSYEGAFSATYAWPNYFEETYRTPIQPWSINLNCYLIGPSRHYVWSGDTFDEALTKCQADVRAWLAEDEKEDA